jgi:hypothetical protein
MSNFDDALKDIKKAVEVLDSNVADTTTKYPNAKRHKYVSFVKSGIRIIACGFLAYYEIQTAAVLFAIAELLGVAEELV